MYLLVKVFFVKFDAANHEPGFLQVLNTFLKSILYFRKKKISTKILFRKKP